MSDDQTVYSYAVTLKWMENRSPAEWHSFVELAEPSRDTAVQQAKLDFAAQFGKQQVIVICRLEGDSAT